MGTWQEWLAGISLLTLIVLVLWLVGVMYDVLRTIASSMSVSSEIREIMKGMRESIDSLTQSQSAFEKEIKEDLHMLDRRITQVEVRCNMTHGNPSVMERRKTED